MSPIRHIQVEAPSQMNLKDLKQRFDRVKRRKKSPLPPRALPDVESFYRLRLARKAMAALLEASSGGDGRIARIYWERRLKRLFLQGLSANFKAA